MKTKTFTVTIEDKEVEFLVKSPTLQDNREAQKVYNQAFTDAIKSKSVVRAKLDDLLSDQGLWDNEKQAKFTGLQKELSDGEKRLAKGGFGLNEAKDLAVRMKVIRDDIRDLISVRTSLDNHSAEGQADNNRFNYLVSACVVYNDTKQPYFKDMEDYLNRATEEVSLKGAQILANMMYGLDNDYEKNLPENKFLKKYLRLVDKKGRFIDAEGRLVDENGRFINDSGDFVDKFGNLVDSQGDFIVEQEPFLDDSGQPVIVDEEVKDEEIADTTSAKSEEPESPRASSAKTKSKKSKDTEKTA